MGMAGNVTRYISQIGNYCICNHDCGITHFKLGLDLNYFVTLMVHCSYRLYTIHHCFDFIEFVTFRGHQCEDLPSCIGVGDLTCDSI